MPRDHGRLALAIAIDALALGAAGAALAFAYWLATGAGGSYLRGLSDLLFLAGGLIITLGAFIELFHVKGTANVHRLLCLPLRWLEKPGQSLVCEPDASREEPGAGWPLIFLGAALIALSIAASLEQLR